MTAEMLPAEELNVVTSVVPTGVDVSVSVALAVDNSEVRRVTCVPRNERNICGPSDSWDEFSGPEVVVTVPDDAPVKFTTVLCP